MVQWRLLAEVSISGVHVKGSLIEGMSGRSVCEGELKGSVGTGSKRVIGEGAGGRSEVGMSGLCLRLRGETRR